MACNNLGLPIKAWLLHLDNRCSSKVAKRVVPLLRSLNKEELKALLAASPAMLRLLSGKLAVPFEYNVVHTSSFYSSTIILIITLDLLGH
jgi:hypothetical protein